MMALTRTTRERVATNASKRECSNSELGWRDEMESKSLLVEEVGDKSKAGG